MNKLKLIACIVAALALCCASAEDEDCGALITTSNIEGTASVANQSGANAGKATITINNNSGTANAVTVYNTATVDSALAGKASTGDVSALQNRATALENATNILTAAVANCAAYDEDLKLSANGFKVRWGLGGYIEFLGESIHFYHPSVHGSTAIDRTIAFPSSAGTAALTSDIPTSYSYTSITNAPWLTSFTETDPTVPSWAKASVKPSYNFSEIGSKPTTISGYGITDAKIANGVITLGANTITPVTTETDPVWTSEKSGYVPTSRKVAGKALTGDVTLSNLSIVGSSTTTYNGSATASVNLVTQTQTSTTQSGTTGKNLTIQVAATSLDMGAYYIKIGSDGKPHLMLRQ